MDKKKNIMNIPKQPISQRILKYTLTTAIVFASLWSAAGLEITIERILDAPRQIGILVYIFRTGMKSTFTWAHVKVEFIPVLKIYNIRIQ